MLVRLFAAALAVALAPVVARAADDDNPYKNVKVGDYATYKMTTTVAGMELTGTMTQSVTSKTDKEAKVKVVVSINGMEVPAPEQTIDLTKPYDPTKGGASLPGGGGEATAEKLKEGKEKVKVGGKEYDTTWTTYKVKAKANGQDITADMKVWMAKTVPMGLVKLDTTMELMKIKIEMTMELTETGNKK